MLITMRQWPASKGNVSAPWGEMAIGSGSHISAECRPLLSQTSCVHNDDSGPVSDCSSNSWRHTSLSTPPEHKETQQITSELEWSGVFLTTDVYILPTSILLGATLPWDCALGHISTYLFPKSRVYCCCLQFWLPIASYLLIISS